MRCSRFHLCAAFLVFAFPGCAIFRPPVAESALGALMAERLALARDVARAKHHSGAPVHDPVREAAILAALTRQAVDCGLAPAQAELFLGAQIEASRQVQTELLARWSKGEPLPAGTPADLRTELRPRLDAVTHRLLDALASAQHVGRWADASASTRATLSKAGFSGDVIRIATAPLDAWATREHQENARQRRSRQIMRPRPSASR